MKKEQFYRLDKIKSKGCRYNLIIGERSNGKTFACHDDMITKYDETGEQSAIIRRWGEDFRGKRGQATFDGICKAENGEYIRRITKGKWTTVKYFSGKWFLAKPDIEDPTKLITDANPFCYAFALTEYEHDKSTNYDNVTTILFDEFITRTYYLPDEFTVFCNVLSTIIRKRDNVIIYMCGNTVNKYCPYFEEMGLTKVQKMEQGSIDVYEYGDSGLKVAVEWTASSASKGVKKKSDVYFAFNNPKLKMITEGAWEIAIYPHLPYRYKDSDVKLTFFIEFNNQKVQGNIIKLNASKDNPKCVFVYMHRKTTPFQLQKKDIIFQEGYSPRDNIYRRLTRPIDAITKYIYSFFKAEKVFYQSNEVGEIVRNYIMWSETDKIR